MQIRPKIAVFKAQRPSNTLEGSRTLEKYRNDGFVEARILTTEQAREKGYRDEYVRSYDDYKLYVDGFETEEDARYRVGDLVDCILIE